MVNQKNKKVLKKWLTVIGNCDMISELSRRTVMRQQEPWQINSNATLKIPKREFQRTNFWRQKRPKSSKKESQRKTGGMKRRINMRVWSWLRMNAGGVPNTCKSNGHNLKPSENYVSGGRVSNAWVTCPIPGDTSRKRLLIPHKRTALHEAVWKTPVVWDGPASD